MPYSPTTSSRYRKRSKEVAKVGLSWDCSVRIIPISKDLHCYTLAIERPKLEPLFLQLHFSKKPNEFESAYASKFFSSGSLKPCTPLRVAQ